MRPEQNPTSQAVDLARRQIFEDNIGKFPEQVMVNYTLPSLAKPSLAEFPLSKLNGFFATVSDGLTALAQPDSLHLANTTITRLENTTSISQEVREPVYPWKVQGQAGHGFEFITLADKRLNSIPHVLFHLVSQQLMHSPDYLSLVGEFQAAGMGPCGKQWSEVAPAYSYFLIAPIWDYLPDNYRLPNGTMRLLSVINVHEDEYYLSMSEGPHTLLKALKDTGVPPVVDFNRPSVLR